MVLGARGSVVSISRHRSEAPFGVTDLMVRTVRSPSSHSPAEAGAQKADSNEAKSTTESDLFIGQFGMTRGDA